MKAEILGALSVLLLMSCRTARQQVEVMDENTASKPASNDYLRVDATMVSSLTVTAISLPASRQNYDRLVLFLRQVGSTVEEFKQSPYVPGQTIEIEAYTNYELVVSAWQSDQEIYSSRFCNPPQKFYAELGRNMLTASLCLKN
jgi:hypothetical protein